MLAFLFVVVIVLLLVCCYVGSRFNILTKINDGFFERLVFFFFNQYSHVDYINYLSSLICAFSSIVTEFKYLEFNVNVRR